MFVENIITRSYLNQPPLNVAGYYKSSNTKAYTKTASDNFKQH